MPRNGAIPAGGLDVEVLVVGGGVCGLTLSNLLSDLRVSHLVVERHEHTSELPKAHYLNSRTMEIFDQIGLADQVYRGGTTLTKNVTSWYTSLGGRGRTDRALVFTLDAFGGNGLADAYGASSAYPSCNLPQKHLEPLLRRHAERRNPGRICFGHELVSFEQTAEGVVATVAAPSGERIVRAVYLVGADGGRFVGPATGIRVLGTEPFVRVVGIHFAADLSAHLQEDHSLIRRIVRMREDGTLLQSGLVTMGPTRWDRFSEEWHITPIVPIGAPSPVHDEASAIEHIQAVLQLPDIRPDIIAISNWLVEGVLAERFRDRRVLLAGDAAHRHPPTTGLGLNSAVQDAHNLAWKVALVLRGSATDALLDSYEHERRPVCARNVEWAMFTYFNGFATRGAWGVVPEAPAEHNIAAWHALFSETDDGASRRARLHEFLRSQRTEYQARDIEMGYSYAGSPAVVGDGAPAPERDPMGSHHIQVARPGHRLPHAWLDQCGDEISTHHLLTDPDTFVLIAGPAGRPWLDAARRVTERTGVPVTGRIVVGSAEPTAAADSLRDLHDDWNGLRGHDDGGAVLVRPDGHIGYRAAGMVADPQHELHRAMCHILGAAPVPTAGPAITAAPREDGR